jgi:hypothetical protein
MKRIVAFALLALVLAATAYGVTRYLQAQQPEDQWTWLRREFHLSDPQFAQVRALHDAYRPVCADHCRRVLAVRGRMDALEHSGSQGSPEYAAAREEWEAVRQECNRATLAHLREVAAAMNPEDGRRYLSLTVPRVETFDHREPRGVR